jgi:hypothetical protein
LQRSRRITALNTVMPMTLTLLKPALRTLLDGYWEAHPVHDVRFTNEAARFIAWLETQPPGLPEPIDDILLLARRELAIAGARLEQD